MYTLYDSKRRWRCGRLRLCREEPRILGVKHDYRR